MMLEQFTFHAPAGGIIDYRSPPETKIALFRALFRGRADVYPRRFESRRTHVSHDGFTTYGRPISASLRFIAFQLSPCQSEAEVVEVSSKCFRIRVKPLHPHDAGQNEYREHDQLRDEEWRLGLRRRERLQERQLLKGLHDPDEDVR